MKKQWSRRIRQGVATFLIMVLVSAGVPSTTWANPQKPIQGIEKISVSHFQQKLAGGGIGQVPQVQVDWIEPKPNEVTEIPGLDQTLSETYYDITLRSLGGVGQQEKIKDLEKEKIDYNQGVYSLKLEEYFKEFIENGTLYEIKIDAKHKHDLPTSGGKVDAEITEEKIPLGYFLTDFNLRGDAAKGLTLSWEYIPGMSYRLFHDKGNITDVKDMSSPGIFISSEEAKAHVDQTGKRVTWHIEEAIVGQNYSAYVLPAGLKGGEVGFQQIAYNKDTPKIIHITPNILLEAEKLGEDRLRLIWNIKQSPWVTVSNLLYQTKIYEINKKGEKRELGIIYNENNGNIDVGYFECAVPTAEVTYQVDFYLKNTETALIQHVFSAGPLKYTPDKLKQVPYKPIIPELFPYQEGDLISKEDLKFPYPYQVKFNGVYNDVPLSQLQLMAFRKNTFHYDIQGDTASIQLVWDAPQQGVTGEVDYDLSYNIWLTENVGDSFKDEDKIVSHLRIEKDQEKHLIYQQDGKTVVGMKATLEGLPTNKTYTLQMTAVRSYGDGDESVSLPVIRQITIPKKGEAYAPPMLGKPPLQLDKTTKESLTIKWAKAWYEIMATAEQGELYTHDEIDRLLAIWGHSRVYLTGNKEIPIAFRDPKGIYGSPTDLYGSTIEEKLKPYEEILKQGNYLLRAMTVGEEVGYKVQVIKEKEVNEEKGNDPLEEWVMKITKDEIEDNWKDVTDLVQAATLEGVEAGSLELMEDKDRQLLSPNTSYVILIAPYREIEGKRIYSKAPSYVLATTATGHESEEVTPKTPTLYQDETKDIQDTQITVRWQYNLHFDYELVYSTGHNPDEGTFWTFTEKDQQTFMDGKEAVVTISGLLPETSYHFWLRAKTKGGKVSKWSNPLDCKTHPIAPPLPPSGLGLAAYESILEAGLDFKPKGMDYLTLEWMRIAKDLNNTSDYLTYNYIIEIGKSPDFAHSTVLIVGDEGVEIVQHLGTEEITPLFINKQLVQIKGLSPNTPYYFRINTQLTYENGDKKVTKYSQETLWVRLITGKTDTEYDGGYQGNPIIFEKPIKESYENGIWTYELQDIATLTNEILQADHAHYVIDMSYYQQQYDVKVRQLKIPCALIKTLIQQDMVLEIRTGIGLYNLPVQGLKEIVKPYQREELLQIKISRSDLEVPLMHQQELKRVYQRGEQLQLSIAQERITRVDSPMEISMKMPILSKWENYEIYHHQEAGASFKEMTVKRNSQQSAYLSFETFHTGFYGLYEKPIPSSSTGLGEAMQEIIRYYDIEGLGTIFFKDEAVGVEQYIKLILGIALKNPHINLKGSATYEEYRQAKQAGFYISSQRQVMTKEQALTGVIRLYEIQIGRQIKPSQVSLPKVSQPYRVAVAKAYAIGLIEDISPQQKITYEELCQWLTQLMV